MPSMPFGPPLLALALLATQPVVLPWADRAAKLARTYGQAIEKINRDHAAKPKGSEADLAKRLPAKASKALAQLLELDDEPEVFAACVQAGEAALDLDRIEDFESIRARLAASPEHAAQLGVALSRPRFQLRGLGGLEGDYLENFAEVLQAVLEGYDEVFGFEEYSKVPGKKLRVRVHLEERITRPPHFAPQFPFHSEIDFPVADGEAFRSPTADGKFLFYGLCHELGHVIAMWGDRSREEDHHAWAHYTGVVVCERVLGEGKAKALRGLGDDRWRSMDTLRAEVEGAEPGLDSRQAVLVLLLRLHDDVGPAALGDAINHLDAKDRRLRVNRVRYYSFDELRSGLEATLKAKKARKRVADLWP